jgi:hypothetical protein
VQQRLVEGFIKAAEAYADALKSARKLDRDADPLLEINLEYLAELPELHRQAAACLQKRTLEELTAALVIDIVSGGNGLRGTRVASRLTASLRWAL